MAAANRPDDPVPRWAAWAVLAVLVVWSAIQRWRLLSSSPFPFGVDGYFYPLQLRALLETGHLQYPAAPLAFYLLAPFAAATDPVTGAKLGAAILGALVAVPAYGAGARLGGSRGAGLVAAALATTSAGSTYVTIEFVKNGIGLTLALAALWAALAAIDRPTRARIAAAAIAAIAAVLAHKMAAALAIVVIAPAIAAGAIGSGRLFGRRLIYATIAVAGLGLAAVIAGVVFPQRFLSPADLAQVRGLIGAEPRWALPALAGPHLTLAMGHEALIAGVLAVIAIAAIAATPRVTSPAERTAAVALALLALVIALPWLAVEDPEGLGFRLRIAAFVPMAMLAAVATRPLVAAVAALAARARLRDAASRAAAAPPAAAIAIALLMPPVADRAEGRVVTHPALASAAMALAGQVPTGATLVVPERHVEFMIAWYTRAPVAARPDGLARDRLYRVMPLAFIGAGSPLDHALDDARREPALEPPLGLHARHPNGLVLVAEPTWDWVLARLPERARRHFAAWPTI